jgi:D-alanyl-lipoteichoic acid acyltransferase DltB (MBOAT superfamily)
VGIRADLWAYGAGVMVTFTLAGLWHGAAWTFAAWGALHGGYLVASRATARLRRRLVRTSGLGRRPRLHAALQTAVTFLLVSAAWILFRADSFGHAWTYVRYLQLKLPWTGVVNLLFDVSVVAAFLALEWAQRRGLERASGRPLPIEARAVGYALFVAVMLAFSVDASDPFIYFRF